MTDGRMKPLIGAPSLGGWMILPHDANPDRNTFCSGSFVRGKSEIGGSQRSYHCKMDIKGTLIGSI